MATYFIVLQTRFLTLSKESNEELHIDVEMEMEETIYTNKCLSSPTHSVISNASSSSAFFDNTSIISENSVSKTIQPLINTYLSNIKMYEGNKTFFLYLKKFAA